MAYIPNNHSRFPFSVTSSNLPILLKQSSREEGFPFPVTNKTRIRARKSLKERMAGYDGDYKFQEWDTGSPVGREVL